MSKSAGSIFIDLLINDAKFKEGLKSAGKLTKEFAGAVAQGSAAAAAAIGVVSAAVLALTVRQAKQIDENVKQARTLGVVNEEFQALALVADEAGLAQENLSNLIVKGQKSIVEAAKGGESMAAAFKSIGLSAKELLALSPDQQFEKIVESLAAIEDPTLRNAKAMEIFSRSGKDAILLLEDLSGKLDEARAFNDKFNISVSEIDARKVEEANDTFGRLGKAVEGLGNTIAIEVAPVVTHLSNLLLQAGIDGEDFTRVVSEGMELVADVIDIVNDTLLGMEIIFVKVASAINSVAEGATKMNIAINEFKNSLYGGNEEIERTIAAQKELLAYQQAYGQAAAEEYDRLTQKAKDYVSTSEKIAQIQDEATKRAEEAVKRNNNGSGNLDEDRLLSTGAAMDKLNRIYEKNEDIITGMSKAQIEHNRTLAELQQLLEANKISQDQYNDAVGRAGVEFEKARDKSQAWAFDLEEAGKRASQNIQDALADYLFDPADKGFKGMLAGFVDVLRRMAAEAAAANILKGIFGDGGIGGGSTSKSGGAGDGILGGILGGVSKGIGNLFAGFFADGGFIPPGQFGVAGEREAELVYGGRSGMSVVPQGKKGGNVYNIDARGADQGAVMRLEQALFALAGPGVVEQRVGNAQVRGEL